MHAQLLTLFGQAAKPGFGCGGKQEHAWTSNISKIMAHVPHVLGIKAIILDTLEVQVGLLWNCCLSTVFDRRAPWDPFSRAGGKRYASKLLGEDHPQTNRDLGIPWGVGSTCRIIPYPVLRVPNFMVLGVQAQNELTKKGVWYEPTGIWLNSDPVTATQ